MDHHRLGSRDYLLEEGLIVVSGLVGGLLGACAMVAFLRATLVLVRRLPGSLARRPWRRRRAHARR